MDLVQQVSTIAGVDEEKSRAILGSIFTSVRMAIDPATFSKVNAAFPRMDEWMRGIPLGQGRTGEIIALAGAEGLKRQLRQLGLGDQQLQQVGSAVGAAVRQALPREACDRVFERVPLLAG